jgi:hypothetical protein
MVKMDNLPEDIEFMARFLGREDPAIQRLLKVYIRNPKMRDTVRTILKHRCKWAGFDTDNQSVFWPVSQLPPGPLQIGRVVQGTLPGPKFTLPEEIITQHIGMFGHNGTGKSYLAMHLAIQAIHLGYTVWVFDIEDEYRRINPLLAPDTLVALQPENLRFNLFQSPGDWIKPTSWLDELNLLLRGGTFLRDGSLNVFRIGMSKLLERKGVTAGGTDWPSLIEVIEYFEGLKFGPKLRTAGYLESLLNRLVTLADTFEQMAVVSRSNMLEMLIQRSVIFRLHSLVGIPLQSLVSFLLLWMARFREGSANNKPHIVIIEEAHMLASEKSRQDIGESILSRMFRTARKRGISLILCDQVPSELPPAILGNLACRIVMRLASTQSIWSIQNSMSLDRKQAEAISTMRPRRAVVHYTLHPTAFEIEIPEVILPTKSKDPQLCRETEGFLSKIKWIEHENKDKSATPSALKMLAPDDLAGDALLVMVRICESPAEPIDQRCQKLQIDRAREFRARAELDDKGLVAKVEQSIGGKIKFFRPTDKGIAWAQKRKIRVKKFKSGIIHEYLLCQVERHIGLISPKWRLQRNSTIGQDQGLQPDLLVMEPDGARFVVEICCSNLDYDAKNILIEAGIPEIDKVIAVTPDKRTRKSLEKAVKKNCEDSDTDWKKSITTLDAAQCLAENFDWTGTLIGNQKLFPNK